MGPDLHAVIRSDALLELSFVQIPSLTQRGTSTSSEKIEA